MDGCIRDRETGAHYRRLTAPPQRETSALAQSFVLVWPGDAQCHLARDHLAGRSLIPPPIDPHIVAALDDVKRAEAVHGGIEQEVESHVIGRIVRDDHDADLAPEGHLVEFVACCQDPQCPATGVTDGLEDLGGRIPAAVEHGVYLAEGVPPVTDRDFGRLAPFHHPLHFGPAVADVRQIAHCPREVLPQNTMPLGIQEDVGWTVDRHQWNAEGRRNLVDLVIGRALVTTGAYSDEFLGSIRRDADVGEHLHLGPDGIEARAEGIADAAGVVSQHQVNRLPVPAQGIGQQRLRAADVDATNEALNPGVEIAPHDAGVAEGISLNPQIIRRL